MTPKRWFLLLPIYLALLGGGLLFGRWLESVAAFQALPEGDAQMRAMILTATVAFIVASALPFVPGVEIGIAMILIIGAKIVWLVYVSMVAALMISFLVGKLVPARATAAAFSCLGLRRARDLILEMSPLDTAGRLEILLSKAPKRFVPLFLRHRYLALMLLFNLPGNSAIGGGGGIALVAGMSGLFSTPLYFLCIVIAVAPVPLMIGLSRALV